MLPSIDLSTHLRADNTAESWPVSSNRQIPMTVAGLTFAQQQFVNTAADRSRACSKSGPSRSCCARLVHFHKTCRYKACRQYVYDTKKDKNIKWWQLSPNDTKELLYVLVRDTPQPLLSGQTVCVGYSTTRKITYPLRWISEPMFSKVRGGVTQ